MTFERKTCGQKQSLVLERVWCWIVERTAHVTGNTKALDECAERTALLFGIAGNQWGVGVCEAGLCEQRGQDTARPRGNLVRFTEQQSTWGACGIPLIEEDIK